MFINYVHSSIIHTHGTHHISKTPYLWLILEVCNFGTLIPPEWEMHSYQPPPPRWKKTCVANSGRTMKHIQCMYMHTIWWLRTGAVVVGKCKNNTQNKHHVQVCAFQKPSPTLSTAFKRTEILWDRDILRIISLCYALLLPDECTALLTALCTAHIV